VPSRSAAFTIWSASGKALMPIGSPAPSVAGALTVVCGCSHSELRWIMVSEGKPQQQIGYVWSTEAQPSRLPGSGSPPPAQAARLRQPAPLPSPMTAFHVLAKAMYRDRSTELQQLVADVHPVRLVGRCARYGQKRRIGNERASC